MVMVEMLSIIKLSNTAATGHVWLLNDWHVASVSVELNH